MRGRITSYNVCYTKLLRTLPANRGVALHPELDYALVQVEGDYPERLILAEALVKDVMDRAGISQYHNLGYCKGAALELLRFQHPFYDFDVPAILGDP